MVKPPADPELEALVAAALQDDPCRIKPVELRNGRRFWLKRVEHLSLRLRLQKGDPRKSFDAERNGLHRLNAAGLPVPEIALEGPAYFVIADAGPTLREVIETPMSSDAERQRACAAAGRALGQLHWAGLVHGRPAPRDICWDGTAARFIDLERCRFAPRGGWRQGLDLLILVQSCMTIWPQDHRWLDLMLSGYRDNAPPEGLIQAKTLARRLGPLRPVARLLLRLRPNSRELRAIALSLDYLAQAG